MSAIHLLAKVTVTLRESWAPCPLLFDLIRVLVYSDLTTELSFLEVPRRQKMLRLYSDCGLNAIFRASAICLQSCRLLDHTGSSRDDSLTADRSFLNAPSCSARTFSVLLDTQHHEHWSRDEQRERFTLLITLSSFGKKRQPCPIPEQGINHPIPKP